MNISIPTELRDYVDERCGAGGFATPSEFIRHLIREDQSGEAKRRLDQLLLDGLNSGDPVPVDAAFWDDLREKVAERVAKQRGRK